MHETLQTLEEEVTDLQHEMEQLERHATDSISTQVCIAKAHMHSEG